MLQRFRQYIVSILEVRSPLRSAGLFVVSMGCCTLMAIHAHSSSTLSQGNAQDVQPLAAGQTVEREIAGAEVHSYILALSAGEFVRLVVEGRGSDLVLSLQDSQGKTLAQVDSALGFRTHKRLSFVSAQAGDYQLTVRPARKDAAPGSYRLSSDEWRGAESKDESAVVAERVFMEAEALNRQGSGDATLRAIEKYDATLPLWRAAGERLPEGFTLLKIGLALHNLSRFKEAVDRYNQALPVFEEIGDERGVAQNLTNLGWSLAGLGQFQKAVDYYNRSLEIRRRLNEARSLAQTLNLVAEALNALGEPQQAIDRYLEALPLAQAANDASIEAYALNGLGWLYYESGDPHKGLACIDRALPLWRKMGNRRGEAQSLHVRGTINTHWLHAGEAFESFRQASQIWQEVGNRYGEAQVLNNLGILYQFLGDFERARETYLQAMTIWQATGNRKEEARTHNNLGLIEHHLGRLQRSLDYFQQSLAMQVASDDRKGQVHSLHNLGAVLDEMGKIEQSLDYSERALKLAQETGQRLRVAEIMNGLGFIHEKMGNEQRALDYYHQALSATTLLAARINLARLERKRGNPSEALAHIEKGIEALEKRRATIPDQQFRVSFVARTRNVYELQADILMGLHERATAANQPSEQYLTAALEASERAHARSLLETLAEARADIRQGADPAALADERLAQDRLNIRETRRVELLNSTGQEKRLAAVEKEIQELERELQDARARIRTRSPGYAALTQPVPLSVSEIRKLLDDDTILLEYLLGKERSFLWAVTPTDIKGYALPGRAEIGSYGRRLHEVLTGSSDNLKEKPTAQSNVTAEYDSLVATLSRILLAPVADQLGKKRLLIVSDGALQYIPFAALQAVSGQWSVVNGRKREEVKNRPPATGNRLLVEDHEIVSLPSASVLGVLRRELASRKPAPKALAVLADPVFSIDDHRVSATGATPLESLASNASQPKFDSDIKRSLRDAGLKDFVRLRFSRQEAEAITSFLPEKDRLRALDFSASRATAQSAELGQYRMLHFATHGLLNSQHPELSGLVFSLVDERGQPQDGFLRFHEIYNLKLNADLVVLSACQTALGKEVRGEGLIGLTRGFMYAGAPRVVASLWRVDDRATAQLMKRFYKAMLLDKRPPAAALRAAQISMLKEKLWSAPHYWAAFIMQGEWR